MAGPVYQLLMVLFVLAVAVTFVLAAIVAAAAAFGARFRICSAATILVSLLFGLWTGRMAPRVEADLPTPWAGVIERASMALFMVWIVAFAILLLRERAEGRDERLLPPA